MSVDKRNPKVINIWYDIPVSASCLSGDEVKLDDIRFGGKNGGNLETNCYEFLDSKYLFDKTIDAIYVHHSDYWLKFILYEETNKIHCYLHNGLIHANIRNVNNLRKMYAGGMFDNKSIILSEGDE